MTCMDEAGRFNGKCGRFRGHPSPDVALAALGAAQWAVFTVEQLGALGLSAGTVQKRAATGRLHRRYRGVYSLVPPQLLAREGRWMAAVLACGAGAVLSHQSAAALHGLRPYGGVKIDVTVPTRSTRKQPGIKVHRSTTLTPADVTVVNNIPCTSAARTMFDLAEVIDRRPLERAFDEAEIIEVFDLRALEDQLRRNPTRPGARMVRAVLDEHYIGTTATRSELEEQFLRLVREAGLPQPEVNAWVVLPGGGPAIRGDFVWREERIIVETDGHKTHGTRQAFESDRRRDQRASAARWRPVRTTWRQLERAPGEVVETVAALMQL
jgi:predicted transcriptional regulator of viral defense system